MLQEHDDVDGMDKEENGVLVDSREEIERIDRTEQVMVGAGVDSGAEAAAAHRNDDDEGWAGKRGVNEVMALLPTRPLCR